MTADATSVFTADWSVSQGLWGTESLTVDASGQARYRFESVVPGEKPIARERALTAADLAPLVAGVRDPRFCALVSARPGIPDEGRPRLAVIVDGRTCEVTLWDGEWRELAAARPVWDAVHALIARLRKE